MVPRFADVPVLAPHGFTRLAYAEWGPPAASRAVICAHGLTRNGRDFDYLAEALADKGLRVAAPDFPGRGRSAWLTHPEDYAYPFYLSAMAAFIARLGVDSVDWVGTSMGGLVGMMLAGQPGTPVRRLVLNDIGATIPKSGLERLGTYVGEDPRFNDHGEVETHLRRVLAPFGPLTDEQWRHLAQHSAVLASGGRLRLHHDPAIARPFTAGPIQEIALWPAWEAVACPTLILRGAQSDLLTPETVAEMAGRGAAAGRVRSAEIAGCGHAPALMGRDQIALVRGFLLES